jgi:tRNA dimethylallyltransferase
MKTDPHEQDSNLLVYPKKIPVKEKKPRIIVVSGPTASGKTRLSLELAQAIGGEIISADSMQVYRGLDIGTAKASLEDRTSITHHLIDVCDIQDSFNVASFYHQAQEAIQNILSRGNVPIVVGGSGFYIHVLFYGPPSGPPSIPEVREMIEQQMIELGPEVLYERLQILDPTYAATISEHDRHKIVRGLEIIALSERRVSDFPKPRTKEELHYDFRSWFIYYPREHLYSRIERRCDDMIEKGFLDEVKRLESQIRNNPSTAHAIGYRQALNYLSGAQTGENWKVFLTQFKKASRHYAKRQFTWFRKEPLFRWLNIEEFNLGELTELILQDFEQGF